MPLFFLGHLLQSNVQVWVNCSLFPTSFSLFRCSQRKFCRSLNFLMSNNLLWVPLNTIPYDPPSAQIKFASQTSFSFGEKKSLFYHYFGTWGDSCTVLHWFGNNELQKKKIFLKTLLKQSTETSFIYKREPHPYYPTSTKVYVALQLKRKRYKT